MEHDRRRKAPLNPFSPWRSSPESLQRTLVGRDHVLKDILEKIGRFCNGAPSEHCLLIGRRGLGKTHILLLVYHICEKNCVFPGFEDLPGNVLPVIFLEEERYSLNSLVVFLIKTFEKFKEKKPGDIRWIIPSHLDSDEDVIEYCFEILKTISEVEKKKIIIFCDNLEEVFKQWSEKEYKILRAFLSDQHAVMIIGTAVRIFKEIISPHQPFYEFFEIIPLIDLSDPQMMELLKKRFIEDNLGDEFNRKEKYLETKIAAISKLTGGNPRLVVFLFDIVTKKNVFEIENAIEELMESLNEYFRNRFSELAPQERTILDTFAEMDGPATPKEISKKTRIKESSTHVHIKKLKHAGFIDTVEFGKHKITRYDVTERLFRLWRQTATVSGKKKLQILIKFLKLYFTPEELKEDFHRSIKQLDSEFLQNNVERIESYIYYLSYLEQVAEGSLKNEIFDKRTDFLLRRGDYEKVEEELQVFKNEMDSEKKEDGLKLIYKKLIKTHLLTGKYTDAIKDIEQRLEFPIAEEKEEYIETLDRIITKCPDDSIAWYSKGIILVETGIAEEALTCFNKAIELNPKESKFHSKKILVLKGLNRLEEALTFIEKQIEMREKNASFLEEKRIILANVDKLIESIESLQKVSGLKVEQMEYYCLQVDILRNFNHLEKALKAYHKAFELDKKNVNFWEEKKRNIADNITFIKVIDLLIKATELEIKQLELKNYYSSKVQVLYLLNRLEEALKVIEKAIELDGNNAFYWEEKAKILVSIGKPDEGLKCYRESIELDPEDMDHKLNLLGFLIYKMKNLEAAGNYLKEIETTIYDKIKDNLIYLHYKSEYLILTCRFEDALSLIERRLEREPGNWNTRMSLLLNKACLGDFGDNMEGLPGKIIKENLNEAQVNKLTGFISQIMENCLKKGNPQIANGLYLTLLKLKEWHTIDKVQECIGLHLRQLVDLRNRDLFVDSMNSAGEHITDKNLLEYLKAFIYAARYLQEGNKVILEEVFPEIREITLDIIEKFDSNYSIRSK